MGAIGKGGDTAAPEPKEEKLIPAAWGRLSNAVLRLEAAVADLHVRIKPVLSDCPKLEKSEPEKTSGCELASVLEKERFKLDRLADYVVKMSNLVEL